MKDDHDGPAACIGDCAGLNERFRTLVSFDAERCGSRSHNVTSGVEGFRELPVGTTTRVLSDRGGGRGRKRGERSDGGGTRGAQRRHEE
eukprot:4246230-Prymnesium_polylepis.1